MRRRLAALCLVATATGCASAPVPNGQVVLRMVMADDWASVPAVGEAIEAFEREHPGVRVEVDAAPFSRIPELVGSAIEDGEPHDVAHWHAFAAAAAGVAEPLDDLWEAAGLTAEEYLPGALQDVTWDRRRYGVPLDTNALVLLANRDRLSDAGIAVEDLADVEDFHGVASSLVVATEAEYALSVSTSSWVAYGWIVACGGDLLSGPADATPTFTFDDPDTIAALEMIVDLVEDGLVPPFPSEIVDDAVTSFAAGELALHASGSWDLPLTARARAKEGGTAPIEVLPLPQADPTSPRTVLGGSSLFVPLEAPNRALAFELMLALTEDDVAVRLAAEEGRLPARARVFDDELFESSADLAAFVRQLETAIVMPLIAYPEVAAAFRDALEDVLAQRVPPAEAMEDVQRQAERWLRQR